MQPTTDALERRGPRVRPDFTDWASYMQSLANILDRATAQHPDRVAIVSGGARHSYREVNARANQVAHLLKKLGLGRGDNVAMSIPNVVEFTTVYFGILKAGCTVVPLNTLLTSREVAYHLADSDASVYIAYEGTDSLPIADVARVAFDDTATCRHFFILPAGAGEATPWAHQKRNFETVEVPADATAVILYTSGTTGRPKGAELTHRNMTLNARAGSEMFGNTAERPDVYLCSLPLFHSFGQTIVQNGAFAFGGTVVMLPRFEPGIALSTMREQGVTVFSGVPTMYWALLNELDILDLDPDDPIFTTLRVAITGGAAMPREIHRAFRARFGTYISEGYGLSETSPAAAFSVYGQEPKAGSIGVPISGVRMKLINDDWSEVSGDDTAIGEIAIKGHNVMKGYYNRPDDTAEAIHDNWFRTGDLATRDADGFYYIVDRSKDMIIRGGFNVYPREIEDILMEHPAISLVAVIGIPDESHGEEVLAIVILAPGHQLQANDLIAWSKQRLAAYKYPRRVEFVDSLPMTSTGKLLKRELQAERGRS